MGLKKKQKVESREKKTRTPTWQPSIESTVYKKIEMHIELRAMLAKKERQPFLFD